MQILIKRTKEAKEFPLPGPKKEGDVGFDLYVTKQMTIHAHNPMPIDVPSGMRIKLPEGTWGLVINRSSTPRKMGIEIVPGLIDNGYTGELFACCFNRTDEDIRIPVGARLAQFVVLPALVPEVKEVEDLPETLRGETGFGSTGI